jgi:hypothetical protein
MTFRRGLRDPWFCLPVILCVLLDAGFTLGCQPAEYWSRHAVLNEGNPAWEWLLARGPAVFVAGFVVYGLALCGVLAWLTGTLQKLLGAFVLLAHSYGAATWCHTSLPESIYWWALLGIFLLEAAAFAAYWRLSPVCRKEPAE